ncbi:hypothetical protein GCM10010912_25670 [Paenibacillus albidus]|uniref:Serine protease n=1 Tax=Paenibacillus albidus TaxID=2041023 RepID=A0A917FI67_9BACL|nr:hypothetical protein [Paenibacillus albidus]GGF79546.1 hypothetical protein GCM10010912_25670 [Paenibacillus albidus]
MATFAEALAVKKRIADEMLKNPKVQGIGVGYHDPKKRKKGAAVVLYANAVSTKALGLTPKFASTSKGKTLEVPIRVVQTKKIRCNANYRGRIRPVIAGYSIGTQRLSGTAGLIVASAPSGNQRYILSNNHVLTSPINTANRAETLQPGGADGGQPGTDRVGHLSRFVRLRRNGSNLVDAALSRPVRNSILSPRYATVGRVPGHVTSYRVGERFKKVGRTTGLTFGRVDSVNTDVQVNYGSLGVLTFRNQTVILGDTPVSLPGDSGSVWLRRADNFAAAVNFAGTQDGRTSISFPVDWALSALRVRVAQPASQRTKQATDVKSSPRSSAYTRRLTAKELAGIKVIRSSGKPKK